MEFHIISMLVEIDCYAFAKVIVDVKTVQCSWFEEKTVTSIFS